MQILQHFITPKPTEPLNFPLYSEEPPRPRKASSAEFQYQTARLNIHFQRKPQNLRSILSDRGRDRYGIVIVCILHQIKNSLLFTVLYIFFPPLSFCDYACPIPNLYLSPHFTSLPRKSEYATKQRSHTTDDCTSRSYVKDQHQSSQSLFIQQQQQQQQQQRPHTQRTTHSTDHTLYGPHTLRTIQTTRVLDRAKGAKGAKERRKEDSTAPPTNNLPGSPP